MASDDSREQLTTAVEDNGGLTLRFTGEIDVATADEFRGALDAAIASSDGDVRVDMSHVRFMDSMGIGQLVGAANRLDPGRRLVIQHPRGLVQTVLEVTGIAQSDSISVEPDGG